MSGSASLTDAQILEQAWAKRSGESIRFDVVDVNGAVKPAPVLTYIDKGNPPTVANNTAQAVYRTITGLIILPESLASINVLTDRIAPKWLLPNGSVLPLGEFVFGAHPTQRHTWGSEVEARLSDQRLILDQKLSTSVGYPTGTPLTTIMVERFAAAGITRFRIDGSALVTTAPLAWAAGRDSHLTVFDDVNEMAAFMPVYFANDGYGICRQAPDLATAVPSITYPLSGVGARIDADSIIEDDNVLDAPNVYIVLDSGSNTAELVGRFYVPDSAPNSVANRGFEIPKVVDSQGLADQAAADAAAQAAYAADRELATTISYTAPPDPRHDTFDVIGYDVITTLEQSWSLQLLEGGAHQHDLRRAWA